MTPTTGSLDPASSDGEPQRFFFVHVPKTAGTSLFVRLRHHFGYRAVYPLPEHEGDLNTSIGIDLMLERFALNPQIRVITGHFPLCAAEMLDVPVTAFTILRDPVERILSFLRQQQRDTPRYAGLSLAEIYDDDNQRWGFLTNYAVRQFSIEPSEFRDGPQWTDDERVHRAKARLVEKVDLVGVQEDFEGFCEALSERYGWDLGEAQKRNITEQSDAPDRLRERILADNQYDQELYLFAADLWTRRTGRALPT